MKLPSFMIIAYLLYNRIRNHCFHIKSKTEKWLCGIIELFKGWDIMSRWFVRGKIVFVVLIFLFISGCQSQNLSTSDSNHFNERSKLMKIEINGVKYDMTLENNDTVQSLLELIPLEFEMQDLHGNEKFVYLNTNLPMNSSRIGRIHKGDVMLYQDNCFVIFYKDFETTYSYTKIGTISNLPDLDQDSIHVSLTDS